MPENIYRIGRQELKERLDKILKEDFPFGIIINGEWGIGKTYFWRDFINKFAKENKKIKTAYVSLFEAESLSDVKRSVAVQLLSKRIGRFIRFFEKIDFHIKFHPLNISVPFKTLFYLTTNNLRAIICFDEFERLNPDKVSFETLIGFISLLKENNSCKVIIIVNENET